MKALGMTPTEYRSLKAKLNVVETNKLKLEMLNGLKDLTIEQKNIIANNIIKTEKYKVDMSNFNDFESVEEWQKYWRKNGKTGE